MAGAGHPHVARAQRRLEAVEDGDLPVVAVGAPLALGAGRLEAGAPPGGYEIDGSVTGDAARGACSYLY